VQGDAAGKLVGLMVLFFLLERNGLHRDGGLTISRGKVFGVEFAGVNWQIRRAKLPNPVLVVGCNWLRAGAGFRVCCQAAKHQRDPCAQDVTGRPPSPDLRSSFKR